MTMHISTGNQKVIDTRIFNLPCKATCPGATAFCKGKCYANKAERMYQNVRDSRAINLDATMSDDFADALISKVGRFIKPVRYFRIHESGDFYSQAYLDKWIKIARMFPAIRFLAFTKSYMLDFSKRPSNLQVVYSVMPDTTVVLDGLPIAYAGTNKESATLECMGECGKCRACWNLRVGQSVYFKIH